MVPHPALLAVGVALGLVVGSLSLLAPRRARPWALALAPLTGLLVGPGLAAALDSWSRPAALSIALVGIGLGFAATGGASATEPLGPVGSVWCLAAVAGASALAVPDTEGPVLATGLLLGGGAALTAAVRRRPGSWPTSEPAAAVGAAAVALVATGGATDGIVAGVGALGCAAVLLGVGPLGRHAVRPAVPPWLAAPVVAGAAVLVARLGAVRASSLGALAVTGLAVGLTWGALEVGARITSGPAPPRR